MLEFDSKWHKTIVVVFMKLNESLSHNKIITKAEKLGVSDKIEISTLLYTPKFI